jgi:hypothetical protein
MSDDARSYPLPTETLPTLDPSHHLQDLLEIRAFFESRGVQTKNTRIERYCDYLERSLNEGLESVQAESIFKNSAGEPFQSAIDWHLYVLREVHELMWILKGLKTHVPKGAEQKLRLVVGGRDFAALDVDSLSRNTQFELRIASYFCQSGCEVDMSTETDVIALRDRNVFYVECKRVGSSNKLGMRLSEARQQLSRRMPRRGIWRRPLGCIAVDVTKVAFSHNGLTWAVTNEHSRDLIQDKLVEIATNSEHHMSFETCPTLLCYWLQIHIPSLVMQPSPTAFMTRFSSYHIQRPFMKKKDAKVLGAFFKLFEAVSKNDARALPGRSLTPRDSVNFLKGTRFGLEDVRIRELLKQETVSDEEKAEVIGSMVFDGIEDNFTFFEVCSLPEDLISEWKQDTSIEPGMHAFMLLGALYQRRYPYEESERTERPGSVAVRIVQPGESED